MTDHVVNRRGFLTKLAAVCGGLGAVAVLTKPAQARSHRRWGWGYYGGPRISGRRFYGGGFYGGYGPGYYSRGYYGVPYGGGYYANPYYGGVPYGGGFGGFYRAPVYPSYGAYPPILKNDPKKAADVLSLLEC